MNIVIDGKDWSKIETSLFDFERRDDETNETTKKEQSQKSDHNVDEKEELNKRYMVDDYFQRYASLYGHDSSPFNLGIYCEDKVKKLNLKATQYVGVVPLLKKGKYANEKIEEYPVIKVSSRFNISPTEMLVEVLAGDDYYENPGMLKTRSYTEKEWKELEGKKAEEKVLFGVVNGVGQIDLSHQETGDEEKDKSNLGIVETYGVFEIIDFVNKAKEICKKNLKKQSQRVEENLNCKVKGRILVQKQIKYNEVRGQKQKMYCAYNTMSEDIKENQIIKYALHLCRKKSGIGDSLVEDIQFCMNALCGVPLKKCSTSDFVGLKNNGAYRQYKDVLTAAKKIISRYSLSYESSASDNKGDVNVQLTNHKVLPYFIDMNLLFEYYCRAIFRKAINEYNQHKGEKLILSLESQKDSARLLFKCDSDYMKKYLKNWHSDDEEGNAEAENRKDSLQNFFMTRYIPDIVITYKSLIDGKEKVAAVIDAKYSDVETAEKRSRTHQIMFYMKALGCDYGGLISPSLKNRTKIIADSIWVNQNIDKMREEKIEGPKLSYMPLADFNAEISSHLKSKSPFLKSLYDETDFFKDIDKTKFLKFIETDKRFDFSKILKEKFNEKTDDFYKSCRGNRNEILEAFEILEGGKETKLYVKKICNDFLEVIGKELFEREADLKQEIDKKAKEKSDKEFLEKLNDFLNKNSDAKNIKKFLKDQGRIKVTKEGEIVNE